MRSSIRYRCGMFAAILSLTAAPITLVAAASPPAPQNLQVPTLAYDDRSIVLVWEAPEEKGDIVDYHLYQDGKSWDSPAGTTIDTLRPSPISMHFTPATNALFIIRLRYTILRLKGCNPAPNTASPSKRSMRTARFPPPAIS